MKDRIKKFYKDHEDGFSIFLVAIGSVAATTGAVILFAKKIENDNVVCCFREISNPNNGVHIFEIFQKNGKRTIFDQSELKP